MNTTSYRGSSSWGTRLLIALVLILIGAAAATWALAHYQPAARFLGVAPPAEQLVGSVIARINAPERIDTSRQVSNQVIAIGNLIA